MKKSRVIIPALAMIAFAVAASVSGAVAWFTASRSAEITAGTYAVVKTSNNLACELIDTKAVGASVSGDTVSVSGVLSDGSFSHKSNKIYTPNDAGSGFASGDKAEIALNDANLATLLERGTTNDSKTIYTAITWNMKFTVTFGQVPGNIGLYLDNTDAATKSYIKLNSDTGTPGTAKGFRMAFVPVGATAGSAGRATVFADLQTSAKCSYISGLTDEFLTGVGYTSTDYDLIDSAWTGSTAALPTSTSTYAECTSRPDYLGTFTYAANTTVYLEYTVVCWFEGTDENIVNPGPTADLSTYYQSVKANLCFEAINIPSAS